MANLRPPSGTERSERRNRGQLLLVTVLILAAAFIILALVVNSAIFTENLATRDDTAGSEEALEYRAEVLTHVEAAIEDANHDESITTETDLLLHIEREVDALAGLERSRQAAAGQAVEIDFEGQTVGERIGQDNADRNLTDRSHNADWTVASNVERTRAVTFNFTRIDTFDSDGFFGGTDDPFIMELSGPDGVWEFRVTSEGPALFGTELSDEVAFGVRPDGGTFDNACVRHEDDLADGLTVDLTAGTVAGEPCEALGRLQEDGTSLGFGAGVGEPYTISFENTDNVDGTYSMVIDGSADGDVSGFPSDTEPYAVTAIYDVSLSYAYQTHEVVYETDIRAAPGEVSTDD